MHIFSWAIWLALSVFIFGVFFWTTKALILQKATWKAFAARHKLKYIPNKFLQSAVLAGQIDGNDFSLASEERDTMDMRGRKFVTVIQFTLPARMPVAGVVGSGDYRDFVRSLAAKDDIPMAYEGWAEGQVLGRTDDLEKLSGYFTPERMKVIDTLVKQKNVSMLFLFDDRSTFLRLETIDPMLKPGQLDKLIEKLLPMLRLLRI